MSWGCCRPEALDAGHGVFRRTLAGLRGLLDEVALHERVEAERGYGEDCDAEDDQRDDERFVRLPRRGR
jgi:hypothetical protein